MHPAMASTAATALIWEEVWRTRRKSKKKNQEKILGHGQKSTNRLHHPNLFFSFNSQSNVHTEHYHRVHQNHLHLQPVEPITEWTTLPISLVHWQTRTKPALYPPHAAIDTNKIQVLPKQKQHMNKKTYFENKNNNNNNDNSDDDNNKKQKTTTMMKLMIT